MSFDSITEAATRRLARRHSRRGVLGLFGGTGDGAREHRRQAGKCGLSGS
jgi:hypothetical protein